MTNDATDQYVDLNGLRFHYRDWGGSGRPAVLLHGLASNSHIWDMVAPLLAERFAVAALDQRSHGESAGPDDGYDFATIAGDLLIFIEALGLERPLLIGHSWGGNVALELATTHAEEATGLVFVDGGFINVRSRPDVTWEEVERNLAPQDLTHMTMDELLPRAREMWGKNWSPAAEAVLRASFHVQPDGTIRPRLHRERHMKIVRALWDQRQADLFPKVRVPVLILPARRQEEEPARGPMASFRKEELVAQAEANLPRARTVWLEDSIHDVPLQRPELIASVILQAADEGFFDS